MKNRIVLTIFIHAFYSAGSNGQRTINCLDMFAGHGAVSTALTTARFNAASFDIARDPSCDFAVQI
eukprot:794227-Lingulodinium_polyedra.AAC.1